MLLVTLLHGSWYPSGPRTSWPARPRLLSLLLHLPPSCSYWCCLTTFAWLPSELVTNIILGTAFRDLRSDRLYPAVGMKRPNEHLRANFGQSEFVFDIDSLVEMERSAVMEEIKNTPVFDLALGLNETQLIHQLISQYLAHDGYIETARAFAKEVRQENQNLATGTDTEIEAKDLEPKEDTDAIQRQSTWQLKPCWIMLMKV